jgi:hypothetical protein
VVPGSSCSLLLLKIAGSSVPQQLAFIQQHSSLEKRQQLHIAQQHLFMRETNL